MVLDAGASKGFTSRLPDSKTLFFTTDLCLNNHAIFVCFYVIFNSDQWSVRKELEAKEKVVDKPNGEP